MASVFKELPCQTNPKKVPFVSKEDKPPNFYAVACASRSKVARDLVEAGNYTGVTFLPTNGFSELNH